MTHEEFIRVLLDMISLLIMDFTNISMYSNIFV